MVWLTDREGQVEAHPYRGKTNGPMCDVDKRQPATEKEVVEIE